MNLLQKGDFMTKSDKALSRFPCKELRVPCDQIYMLERYVWAQMSEMLITRNPGDLLCVCLCIDLCIWELTCGTSRATEATACDSNPDTCIGKSSDKNQYCLSLSAVVKVK